MHLLRTTQGKKPGRTICANGLRRVLVGMVCFLPPCSYRADCCSWYGRSIADIAANRERTGGSAPARNGRKNAKNGESWVRVIRGLSSCNWLSLT